MNTATDRLLRAQACMEDIVRDTARIEEFTAWLGESARRVSTFSDYYQGKWAVDRDVEDTPVLDVAGEDPPWEAISEHHIAVQLLLRLVADLATRSVIEG